MSKKAKLDLSGAGLKKMAIEHCEKAVFGICAVLFLLLAYWGYQKPVFDDQKDNPNGLISSAKSSEQRIRATKWEDSSNEEMSFAKHRVADETVAAEVEQINAVAADATKYPAYATGEISVSAKPKRTSPEVFAATDVQAKFAYQLVALNAGVPAGSAEINKAIFAPQPVKQERKKRKKKSKKKSGSNSSSGGSEGMMEPPPGGDDGASSPGAGGMTPPDSDGGNTGPIGPMKPDYPVHNVPPEMMAEIEGVPLNGIIPGMADGDDFIYPSVYWRQVVCVTAVVPYKQQLAAYEKALKGTRKYDPASDVPKYLGLVINRRVNGGDWIDITDEIEKFSKLTETVYYPNLVSDQQLDPFLNAQVPAFLLRDFDSFVLHPKSEQRDFLATEEVPEKVSQSKPKSGNSGGFDDFPGSDPETDSGPENSPVSQEQAPAYLTSKTAPEFKQVRFFDFLSRINPGDKIEYRVNVVLSNPNLPLTFVVKTNKMVGSGSMMGPGAGNSGGDLFDSDAGPSAAGGSGAGASTRSGNSGGSSPGPGSGPGSGYMGGGATSGGPSGGSDISKVARLTLEMLGNPRLSDADLDGSIRAGILKFKDMDTPKLTDKGLIQKYGLVSPDSNVSNAVEFTVPDERFVAGGAAPLAIRNANNVEFFDAEPTGELVYFKRDAKLQMEVPGKANVFAGSPMVFDAKTEVLNPLDWTIRWVGPPVKDEDGKQDDEKRGNYAFDSPAIVLDVTPSRAMDNVSDLKQEFLTPAEILVFDGQKFALHNELDDLKEFRHATFATDEAIPMESSETSGAPSFGGGGFDDIFDNESPASGTGNN